MLKYKNFGRKSLREIAEILEGMGLHFGTDITPYLVPETAEENKGAPATPAAGRRPRCGAGSGSTPAAGKPQARPTPGPDSSAWSPDETPAG